jgi:hypothetical protein
LELGETFVAVDGRWMQYEFSYHQKEINTIRFGAWVNDKTQEGIDMICDYIKIGKVDELIIFN